MTAPSARAARRAGSCARCRTELAPGLLSCPACHTLVHSDTLKELAAAAERATAEGKLEEARTAWYRATLAGNLLRGFYLETRTERQPTLPARHAGTVIA